jgi:hypothetical protein
MSRLALAGSAALLLCAACDKLRLPEPPAQKTDTTVAAAAPVTRANRAPRPGAKIDPATAPGHFDNVRRSLRRLVIAEETYYAENGVYTEDLARIGFTPNGGSEIRFLWLGRDGWAASGTHPDVPGRDCVVYVGRAHGSPTTVRDVRPGREGTPVCDALPRAPAPSVTAPPPAVAAERPGPVRAETGNALDAVDPAVQMRVDLRNLVRSQDSWFGTQGTYSRRTEPFALQYLWHRGVSITILSADDESWSARAIHPARPGKSCVIWVGRVSQRPVTEVQRRSPERSGVPVCDD